jgi:hypothetical protein
MITSGARNDFADATVRISSQNYTDLRCARKGVGGGFWPIAEMAVARVGGRLLGWSCRHCGVRATSGNLFPDCRGGQLPQDAAEDVVDQWERIACNCREGGGRGVLRRALALSAPMGWGLWRIWPDLSCSQGRPPISRGGGVRRVGGPLAVEAIRCPPKETMSYGRPSNKSAAVDSWTSALATIATIAARTTKSTTKLIASDDSSFACRSKRRSPDMAALLVMADVPTLAPRMKDECEAGHNRSR